MPSTAGAVRRGIFDRADARDQRRSKENPMATVSYQPNDPLASGGPPSRSTAAQNSATPGKYRQHTPEYQFWQAKLALIAGLRAWKQHDGTYLRRWYGDQRVLPVWTDAGDDLNAFYDRASLQFFSHSYDGNTVNSAESVDVVTHEQGHAFLDAIRPDFFEVPFIEVGALHEAFGDCCAILCALEDKPIRDAVIKSTPDLSANHFVESLAEALGDAIAREYGQANVEVGALRHALNSFSWSDPTTLPANAPADQLSGEVHSFSRVFSGAFYDTIRNIYLSGNHNQLGLRKASRTAGELLVGAIRRVPAAPNTFAGLGQRMLQSDDAINNGANIQAIRDAFEAHGMTLAPAAASLPEPLPKAAAAAKSELRRRLAVPPGTKVEITPVETKSGEEIAHVAAYRAVTLDGLGLEGVRVMVPGVTRVSTTRGGRSITGTLGQVTPAQGDVEAHARAFARALLANGDIKTAPRAMRRMGAAPQPSVDVGSRKPTHEIQIRGGQPELVRIGFR
jgi:hypothetical protein